MKAALAGKRFWLFVVCEHTQFRDTYVYLVVTIQVKSYKENAHVGMLVAGV